MVPKERVLGSLLPCEPALTLPEDAITSSQVLPEVLHEHLRTPVGFLGDIPGHPWDRSSWKGGILFV